MHHYNFSRFINCLAITGCLLLSIIIVNGQKITQPSGPCQVLYDGKIFTASVKNPYAEAVGICNDKIVAVGNLQEVLRLAGKNPVMNDLHGGCLLPGFIDSHNHAIEGGESLLRANVYDKDITLTDLEAYVQEVKQNGLGLMGDIVVVDGLNISTWSSIPELMKMFNADAYSKQAVLLEGSDGHTGWVNQAYMTRAGLDRDFISKLSDEQKKYFGFNDNNEPNGFVADSGFSKINAILPPSKTNWFKSAQKAFEYNNKLGITAWLDPAAGNIQNKTTNTILEAYRLLAKKQALTAHIAAVVVADANDEPLSQIAVLKQLQVKYAGIKNLGIIGFKIFADGVVEYPTQTAALSKPYTNIKSSGVLMFDPKKFAQFATVADKNHLLVHVHAIGDLAVHETLKGFEAVRSSNGNSGIPHTITHIQFAMPDDFTKFHQLGILASYQLLWALGDVTTIDIIKPYIDPAIYQYQYPARSMLQAGSIICGASDWPVSTANPFEAIYEAETRKGKKGVLDSTQRLPRIAMLYAYTINAAKALQLEKQIGSIEAGKFADMILIDRDILTIDPEQMKMALVSWTMFEGRIIYRAGVN